MNKQEFITHISNQHDCTKVEAEKAIDMFTSSVIDVIRDNNDITLQGFGKFYTLKLPTRIGRNPNNGQSVNIPETTYPKFRIGQKLKDACKN
jgi:DNA-binding protein HU-beta